MVKRLVCTEKIRKSVFLSSTINACVAQLEEVSDLDSEGCEFESHRGHKLLNT